MTFKRSQALVKIDTILMLLRAVPMTAHDLAELIPMSRRWTQSYLTYLRTQRRVYILQWDKEPVYREKRHAVPIYAAGRKPDAPKPAPDPITERFKRQWTRIKSDPDKHSDILARRRVRRRLKNLRPDPAAAWIFPIKQNHDIQHTTGT